MRCSACGAENPATAKFCEECGTGLARACPHCGHRVGPRAKFCAECGQALATAPTGPEHQASPDEYTPRHLAEKILASRSALEGERKQVTVLFADLKGSTELIQGLDPEDAQSLLDGAVKAMMEAVHRYEGTVNNIMGDGIMALFGAPLAHEDHAVRACYAALAMQDRVGRYAEETLHRYGVAVQIRVGLNSGEVVVRAIANDLRIDYSAMGQTTHLAARMEQLASPGSILLTPSTLELVEGFVAVKPLGPVPVKGLADAVEVYELTGVGPARTRLQATAARRGPTRFVGRDLELEQLGRALDRAAAGHGQVVALVGEAGVGKSRFVYELTHSHQLQGSPHDPASSGWLVLEASSVSYGKAISYLPVIELLKGYFSVQDSDDLREVREKVTGKLLALDRSLEPVLPALLALLDVPVDDALWSDLNPGQRRQQTLEAVRRLLLREARGQPLLLIFEDLHWIDGETQALLDLLVDSLASARLLLLVNYRPEYRHAWGGKTYYSQLRLDALPAESTWRLLEALLGDDPGLAPLKQLLVRRGNPLFLEETVRTLVETQALAGEPGRYRLTQPIQAIRVPPTVQAMLAARIDRLPPEDKRLLQTASVIGKDVPFGLLEAIGDLPDEALRRGLDRLQAAEFLYETGLYPDLEYSFKHALTHEVTYGGLLQERRRELHARIVEAIEILHRDRLAEQVERLAHHAVRAELRERAVHYLRQAALKAVARSALQDAQAWLEQALAVLEALPESRSTLEQACDIRLELRPVLTQLGEPREALERLREAETFAERLNDDRRRGRVSAFATNIHSQLGELDEARASGTRALAIAQVLGDFTLHMLTTSDLERVHYLRGEYERVVELATDNLAALPAESVYKYFGGNSPTSVDDRYWLVMGLAQLGRFAEAAEHAAEAIRLAKPTSHANTVGIAHLAAGTLHLLKGDWAKASSLIEQAIEVFRIGNVVLLLPPAVASSVWVLAQLGKASEALHRLREGEQLLERQAMSGVVHFRGWAYHLLGRGCLLLGRLDEAQHLGDHAIESSPSHDGFAAYALHLLGDIATHPDRFDAESGGAHYRKALALAEPRGMRPLAAHCRLGLGKLYRQLGRRDEARMELSTAIGMLREMGMTHWLPEAEAELAQADTSVPVEHAG